MAALVAPPPRSRRRLSLRARLLWAFLVPLVIVLALVGVAATTALRAEQLGQVDRQLAAAVDRSARADEAPDGDEGRGAPHSAGPGGPEFLFARGQGDGTLGARVVDGVSTEAGVIGARGENGTLTCSQKAVVAAVPADG